MTVMIRHECFISLLLLHMTRCASCFPISSLLRELILLNGHTTKGSQTMAKTATEYYERLFETSEVLRPHPYVDYSTLVSFQNI